MIENQTNGKYCKNCKFSRRSILGWEFGKCYRPLKAVIEPLTGDLMVKTVDMYCSIERKDWQFTTRCGPEGQFFEPKVTWWTKFRKWIGEV